MLLFGGIFLNSQMLILKTDNIGKVFKDARTVIKIIHRCRCRKMFSQNLLEFLGVLRCPLRHRGSTIREIKITLIRWFTLYLIFS